MSFIHANKLHSVTVCFVLTTSLYYKVLNVSSFWKDQRAFSQICIFRTFVMMQSPERTVWSGPFHILMIFSGSYFSLSHYLSVSYFLWGEIPEIWIRIGPQRIHDLISMCHSDLIGLDTTVEDLKGLKMSLLHFSVCLAVIGGDNEILAAERVENHFNLS